MGLTVLDEPAATQSDPAIIDLKLHQMSKIFSSGDDVPVKKLHRADKNSQQVDNWIQNIKVGTNTVVIMVSLHAALSLA